MEGDGTSLSGKVEHAVEVLYVIQTTKALMAYFLKMDVAEIDGIFKEIESRGLSLMSKKAEDNQYYYWLEK